MADEDQETSGVDPEDYAELFSQLIADDKPACDLYRRIDDAIDCKYLVPPELSDLSWIRDRNFAQTHLADAVNAAVRPFASRVPQISIQPLSDDPDEYERTDLLEDAMEWEFHRMNRYGRKSSHWQLVESAMRYNKIAMQTEYLPYKYRDRKNDPRIRALLAQRNYNWVVHHPATVHGKYSDEGLEGVLKHALMTLEQLILMFGKDNPGVKKMLLEAKATTPADLAGTYITFVDYMDWKNRFQGAVKTTGDQATPSFQNVDYVFLDKPHKMSFLPWVIIDGGHPLIQPIVESGMWDNFLHMKTIEFSKGIELAASNRLHIATPDGTLKGVHIDTTNPNQPIVTELGIQVNVLPPSPMDPTFTKLLTEAEEQIYSSTASRVLADVGRYATSALGTVQTIVQAALGQLASMQDTIERAEAMAIYQNFMWIKQSAIGLTMYQPRDTGVDKPYRAKGAEVTILAGDPPADYALSQPPHRIYFDEQYLYVDVRVEPNASVDRQAKLNEAANKINNLGASREMVYDEYGLGEFGLHTNKRADEDLILAEVKAEATLIVGEAQAKVQADIAKASAPPAPPTPPTNPAPPPPGSPESQAAAMNKGSQYAGAAGMMTQGGGQAPQTNAPMETRNTITGHADNGAPMP